jgi:hypothetical protein
MILIYSFDIFQQIYKHIPLTPFDLFYITETFKIIQKYLTHEKNPLSFS